MSGSPGERLGPYELVSRIGAGGMGEVWRARDTRLDRSVAVKILPADFASDARLRIRFEREARTISQLDHPHICALYDVGENYLVMELLDGESLEERVRRGPMPIADVTRYGAQIADALGRAHRAGVVHRDVKPGNIMITRAGAKLLDFGLAKSFAAESGDPDKTAERPLTSKGIVVGTLQYMAPEQIGGSEADARTDIFALGATLYEMVTGRAAFEGTTRTAIIAAIVSAEPTPIAEIRPDTPPALQHLIATCLNKDRESRWQSAQDVAEELRWISSAPGVPVTVRRKSRERWAWIAAVTAVIALLAIAAWLGLRPRPEVAAVEASIPLEPPADYPYGESPALSPDGKWLAYVSVPVDGRRRMWLRSLDGSTLRATEGVAGSVRSPFWSPDSRFIAYSCCVRMLRKNSAGGGQPTTLAADIFRGFAWSHQDVILYSKNLHHSLYRVSASGGDSKLVLRAGAIGAQGVYGASFLPDGNHFLFTASGQELEKRRQNGIWVATLDGSEAPRFLVESTTKAVFVQPGYLVYERGGVLHAQKFDAKTLRLGSDPVAIAPVEILEEIAFFSATDTGLLLYQPPGVQPPSEIVLKNRRGERLSSFGGAAVHSTPQLSPDGKRVAVERTSRTTGGDIWIATPGGASRFSFDSRTETTPIWSPLGDEILYAIDLPPAGSAIFRQRIGAKPRLIHEMPGAILRPVDWSPDGRHVTFIRFDPASSPTLSDVVTWAPAENKWTALVATPANEVNAVFSPDGKWIAYQSDESGPWEIYAQPFPPTGAKYQVSTAGGRSPRWTKQGEIIWVDLAGRLHAAKVETAPEFRAGTAEALFPVHLGDSYAHEYDVTSDGNFLVLEPLPSSPPPLKLLVNWHRRFTK